ncbi:MAG: CotH kinase family protein [Oscillospiraceae bacterium]
MKYRRYSIAIACLVVVLSLFFQLSTRDLHVRYHQHKQSSVTDRDVPDPLGCITPTPKSATEYDPGAVDVKKLQTHLPIVLLDVAEEIPGVPYYEGASPLPHYTVAKDGDDEVLGTLQVIDNKKTFNTPQDPPKLRSQMRIRVRGNTSRNFDKKSYAVKLVDDSGAYRNEKVLDMEENHSWALYGPFLDKALIRNYVGMNLSGELMEFAPDVRFCEVIKNGEYQGLYLFMETVSRGKGRVDIEKPNYTKNVTGYILELDNAPIVPDSSPQNFTKYTGVLRDSAFFNIDYPNEEALTPELKDYITRDLSQCEKALYSFDYNTGDHGFQTMMDVNAFADYFILSEVFMQHDTGNLSTYFYKDVNGLFKPCVWDFNHSLGNASVGVESDFPVFQFVSVQAPWFWMMIKDDTFIETVISRYHSLRRNFLSDASLTAYLGDTWDYLGSAATRNFALWGYSFDVNNLDTDNHLHPDSLNPTSYDGAVRQMEDALLARLHWLDEHIEALRQYSHPSAVKKFNH